MLLSLLHAAALGAMATSVPLPEMVVTARKREESLIEVPVAVTAFSADAIEQLGVADIADLARFTPGFALNSALGRQPTSFRPAFRGLTTVRNGVLNTNAGNTFIDGVYVGSALLASELANVERVEIMRGPQSAQYGRNTYAGAINYVTRKPTDTFEATVAATAAEHDRFDVTGWASGPLGTGRVRYALSAGHYEHGGEWHNERDGGDIGGEQSDELSGRLLLAVTENLDINLKLGWQRTDDDHYAIYLQPSTLNNCCERDAEAPRAREYFNGTARPRDAVNLYTDLLDANGESGTRLERLLGNIGLELRLGEFTLSSLTGYISDEYRLGFDESFAGYDPSVPPFTPAGSFLIYEEKDYDDVSQELRLISPGDRPVRYTLGAYFYEGEADTGKRVRINPATGLPAPDSRSRDEVTNRALFGALAWDFASRWTAGLELRWSEDDVRVTSLPVNGPAVSYSTDPESLTPRLTLAWQPTASTHWYANVSKGIKPPDFNTRVPDESFRAVREEKVWNYEIGMKGQYLDGRAVLALAAYHLDVRDQQLTQLVEVAGVGTASLLTNAQRTAVWGLEAEASWQLTEELMLQATYAFTDSEFDEWISQEQADLLGSNGTFGENQVLGSVADKESPRIPEHMGSLLLRYERPLSATVDWYGSVDYSHESSKFAAEHNLIETGDRNLFGLRTGLAIGGWDVSLWARNLFDDDTPVDIIRFFDRRPRPGGFLPPCASVAPPGSVCAGTSTTPRGFAIPLPPGRQLGATVKYRF
jgi:outer membrane receptor protein involved in Fe transport